MNGMTSSNLKRDAEISQKLCNNNIKVLNFENMK